MKIESVDSTKYRLTLHTYELATLISAARWIIDGTEGEFPPEAKDQLSQIVNTYDTESKRLHKIKS